jgi:hypothetical protein
MILIGFQATLFWVYSQAFAVTEGLLAAKDSLLVRCGRGLTLEAGLMLGGGIFLLGLIGAGLAMVLWSRHAFGNMDTGALLRLVDPSALAMILGVQIVLSSFFLSLLLMKKR